MAGSLASASSSSPHASLLRTQRTLLQSLDHITQERDELQKQLLSVQQQGGGVSDTEVRLLCIACLCERLYSLCCRG